MEWRTFKVSDLFDFSSIPQIPSGNFLEKGHIPFVTQTEKNNGISQYINITERLNIENGDCLVVGVDTQVIYYQNNHFYANKMIKLVGKSKMTKSVYLFFVAILKPRFKAFNYSNKLSLSRLKNIQLDLPVTPDNQPDYDFIETFITAQEKLAVQRLSDFRKEQIEMTKAII